jgi:hypothetical protein
VSRAGAEGWFGSRAGAITISLLVATLAAGCGGKSSALAPGSATAHPRRHVAAALGRPAGQRQPALPLGTMAGYLWRGRVETVGATWTVPEIADTSGPGRAGTWIGAQVAAGPMQPFIQVGVNEERLRLPGSAPLDVYYAFWSDTRRGFHPLHLFDVGMGDEIVAALKLSGDRWHVSIADLSNGHSSTFSTSDETGGRFGLAEWLQEDITDENYHRPYPFPQLRSIAFRGLAVDGRPPNGDEMLTQWMSENGTSLAQGRLHDDSFELRAANLTAAGLHYLRIAIPLNVVNQRFVIGLVHWTASTPRALSAAATSTFAQTLMRSINQLSRYPWPPALHPRIAAWERGATLLLGLTREGAPQSGARLTAWRSQWLAAADRLGRVSLGLRAALNVPDITPERSR